MGTLASECLRVKLSPEIGYAFKNNVLLNTQAKEKWVSRQSPNGCVAG